MVHRSNAGSGCTQHSLQYSVSNRGFGIWDVLCHLAINKARVKIWDLRATIFKVHALVCMLKYLALIKRRFWLQNLQLGGDIFIQFLSLEQIYVHLSFLTLIMLIFFCWPFGVRICQIHNIAIDGDSQFLMSLKCSVSEVDVCTTGELFGKPRRLEQGHFSVELPIFLTFSIFPNISLRVSIVCS